MVTENDEMGDYPDDEYTDDYSDDYVEDDSLAEGQYEDEGFDDEYQDEEFEDNQRSSRESQSRSKKKKRRMFCGGCNRMENHRRAGRKSWLNSYITGLTFGINRLVGPFKCTCCGSNRWIIRLKKSNVVSAKKR